MISQQQTEIDPKMQEHINFVRGTDEHLSQLNAKLECDLQTYVLRPFLSKQERIDLSEYIARPGRNRIIAGMHFDTQGNFLPEVYTAPADILKMLYPLDDLIQFDRQGTLIIDREQYHPNLSRLSFFIYIVDEQLYDELRILNNFRQETNIPTYMTHATEYSNIRVFKDYFALVRHLRYQRLFSYLFGPRTMFYLRYYIHNIEKTTTNDDYAFGAKSNDGIADKVIRALQWHLGFRNASVLEHHIKFTEDNYAKFRKLANKFQMNLPEIINFNNKIMIERYSRITMHSKPVCKLTKRAQDKYEHLGIQAWHHLLPFNDKYIAYVWDSREIQAIVNATDIDINHITYNVLDNRQDLKVFKLDDNQQIREFLELNKESIPVQFRYDESIQNN